LYVLPIALLCAIGSRWQERLLDAAASTRCSATATEAALFGISTNFTARVAAVLVDPRRDAIGSGRSSDGTATVFRRILTGADR